MELSIPIIVTVIAAIIGATVLSLTTKKRINNTELVLGLGAGAGIAGALLFMLPLGFCTFEPEQKPIDQAFGILLIVLGMAITLSITRQLLIWFRTKAGRVEESTEGKFKGSLIPYVFLAPTLIILALFLYYPSLDTLRLSTLLTRLGAPRTAFVCVGNFTRLASDASYLNTVVVTLVISLAIVVIGLSLALMIAVLASQPVKGARIYRTLLIWPYAISPVVAGVIFLLMFNPTGGIINYTLKSLFGFQVSWLNDPGVAPWVVILASIWKSLGYNVLFYIAGLQNVPKDLLEAASIDGANSIRRFRSIVIPLLSPITFFLLITNLTYAFFDTFGTIDYLTGGGPLKSTTTMMYRIYEVGIRNNDLGKAAAESIILFVLVIGLTILQFRTSGNRVTYGA